MPGQSSPDVAKSETKTNALDQDQKQHSQQQHSQQQQHQQPAWATAPPSGPPQGYPNGNAYN